ncbi:MAG TPA: exodeoxyribonuclease VII large subunit [Firmicutes bacterium]|nr:exodeoxyribonuclease VII large subunit [Bacillota bacterium]
MDEKGYLSIYEFNLLIKEFLENENRFNSVYLKGEISNYKVYPSGHAYFSLKDDKSTLSCIMWGSNRTNLNFSPKDGDEVLVKGSLNVYPPRGSYTFIVSKMEQSGLGSEALKVKLLFEKLKKEGLFDETNKKPIPKFPTVIGIIAGANSAGLKDIVYNICRRYPLVELRIYSSLVQGKDAPKSIIKALDEASNDNIDTLIIGRGGGSSEDLSAFNDEALIRALFNFKKPIISAVGHEIDVTLTDLVADLRVSTPTGAAIASTPNKDDLLMRLTDDDNKLNKAMNGKIDNLSLKLSLLSSRGYFLNPEMLYVHKKEEISKIDHRLDMAFSSYFSKLEMKVKSIEERLSLLNPYNVLNRGYSITSDEKGKPLTSTKQVKIGTSTITTLKDGIIRSNVMEIKEKN